MMTIEEKHEHVIDRAVGGCQLIESFLERFAVHQAGQSVAIEKRLERAALSESNVATVTFGEALTPRHQRKAEVGKKQRDLDPRRKGNELELRHEHCRGGGKGDQDRAELP